MTDVTPADAARQCRRIARRRGLGLLVATAFLPGSAQVIAGGRGLGRFALKVWAVVVGLLAGFVALALLNRSLAVTVYTHPATQWTVSVAVLVLGLLVFQRDGKILTYVALVLVLGIVQARFFWRTVSRSNDEKSSAR